MRSTAILRSPLLRSSIRRPIFARTSPLASTTVKNFRFYSDTKDAEAKETESAEKPAEASESTESSDSSELAQLKAKLDAKDKECAQFREKYQRSVADFRNLQETTKRELQKTKDFALQKFAKELFDSVDNFDRALSHVKEDTLASNNELKNFYDGIKMTQDIFEKTLANHGVEKLNPIGEIFDPNVHEAVFQVPDESKEPGTVVMVQQTGFKLNDRVVRAPKVGIVKAKD